MVLFAAGLPKKGSKLWPFNLLVCAIHLTNALGKWIDFCHINGWWIGSTELWVERTKGAQYSEPVKSKVPSVWFLWKTKTFLVSRKQKLGLRGQQALLEHNLEYCPFLQGCFHKKERWSKSCFLCVFWHFIGAKLQSVKN